MHPALHIVKIGGKVVDEPALLMPMLHAFISDPRLKILVHGGDKGATQLAEKLGVPTQMVNGRRITDEATLDIALMVYAGLFNKKLVSALQAGGCNALGLSGADGNLILAHKRPAGEIDYGWVGDISRIDAAGINRCLEAGFTPVFCAITHDGQGNLLNTNADTIASVLARALTGRYRVRLLFCFEKKGILKNPDDDHSVMPALNREQYRRLQAETAVSGGILPKLDNAFAAAAAGVEMVVIGSATDLIANFAADSVCGTLIQV